MTGKRIIKVVSYCIALAAFVAILLYAVLGWQSILLLTVLGITLLLGGSIPRLLSLWEKEVSDGAGQTD